MHFPPIFRQAESLAISNEKLQAHSILDSLLQEESKSKLTAELKCKVRTLLNKFNLDWSRYEPTESYSVTKLEGSAGLLMKTLF